jgi:uncharacterized repeat protein (TIGR01451 family)
MRVLFNLFASAALIGGVMVLPAALALADSNSISFESPTYSPGSIDGQDGWAGSGGGIITPAIDQAVVANSGAPASFAAQSFRMSNAYTDGAFGGWPYSRSLTDEAGETNALNGGFSGGSRQPHFEAQWDVASTVPLAEQTGLQIAVSPDRGDGARMSWIRMRDTSAGLAVDFQDYQDLAPLGSVGNETAGCDTNDLFVLTTVATGLDRTVRHTIKLTMDLLDGPHNDIVKVYVDGTLVHTGTSWEDYYRWCAESNPLPSAATDQSRTIDSLLFRASVGSGTAPGTLGNGFLFDNLSYLSGPRDLYADLSVSKTASPEPVHIGQKLTYSILVTNNGPDAATGVSLTDSLPKNAGFGSVTTTQGTCTLKPAKQQVTCSLGAMASGATARVTIVVKPTKKGTITNRVDVASTSPADPNTLNNTFRLDTVVLP